MNRSYHTAILAAVPLAFLLSSCAAITSGTSDVVSVNTVTESGEPLIDAICILTSPGIDIVNVVTPETVTLERSKHNIAVNCSKECYVEATGVIVSDTEEMLFGNILLGGFIGAGVDAVTGASNDYESSIVVEMASDGTCV